MAKNLVNSNNIEVVTSNDDLRLDFSTTVKQKIEQIEINKNNIANLKGKILWTNPNPTIAFEQQTINLSSNDYDFYEIIITPTTNTVNNYVEVVKGLKGKGTYLKYFTSDGIVYRRKVDYVDDTKLTIDNPTAYNGTIDNINIIPLYVIGYKTGLFN